jgi:DNA transposition AAA+ family ATPase
METQTQTQALVKVFPCDMVLRTRCQTLLDTGTIQADLSRRSGVPAAVLSVYLSPEGNKYTGNIEVYERKLEAYLARRDLETLAGIPTIKTPVSDQIATAARMARRARLMVKTIGRAGIGKTRGASLLSGEAMVLYVSRETGTREGVRARLFKLVGIRGPRKRTAERRRLMYSEMCARLRGTDLLIVVDQAHKLSGPAIDFLCELWNDTGAPQLWLGTEDLAEKLERDEQWASRLATTVWLEVAVDAETNEVRELVQHQIKSRISDLNGETLALTNLCEKLALHGNFRRVEMRLATMLCLSESGRNKDKTWKELFSQSAAFEKEGEA